MQKNENPVVLSAVLLIISVIVALILAFTNSITEQKIAENTQKEQDAAKKEVMADATEFIDLNYSKDSVKAVYQAMSGESICGWCVSVAPNGYGGEIDLMVGVDMNFNLTGIKVVSNSETAGLGAKCTEDKFSSQFAGKTAPVSVIKNGEPTSSEIVAITGATITSSAVTEGVNEAVLAIKEIGGGLNE